MIEKVLEPVPARRGAQRVTAGADRGLHGLDAGHVDEHLLYLLRRVVARLEAGAERQGLLHRDRVLPAVADEVGLEPEDRRPAR